MLHLKLNGETLRTISPGASFALPNGDVVSPAYAGWSSGDCELVEVIEPEPTAEELLATERAGMTLTFAQLLIGLVSEGWITATEGRAWRDRVSLPTPVINLIQQFPVEDQFAVETRAFAPSVILRLDPLVVGLGLHTGKTPEQIDDFFRKYQNA